MRNDAFKKMGLFESKAGISIPASTGIQGRGLRSGWCTVDVLAVRHRKDEAMAVRRLVNPRQNEAPEYGSAFARALQIDTEQTRYVLVSGTASIDDEGRSIHDGLFRAQDRTDPRHDQQPPDRGRHPISGTSNRRRHFLKNPADYPAYCQIMKERWLDHLPVICTVADVCRPELLFEMDASAVVDQNSV